MSDRIVNETFIIQGRKVEASAWFTGKAIVFKVWVDGDLISEGDSTYDIYSPAPHLKGAAAAAYDKKWLKTMAENELEAAAEMAENED